MKNDLRCVCGEHPVQTIGIFNITDDAHNWQASENIREFLLDLI